MDKKRTVVAAILTASLGLAGTAVALPSFPGGPVPSKTTDDMYRIVRRNWESGDYIDRWGNLANDDEDENSTIMCHDNRVAHEIAKLADLGYVDYFGDAADDIEAIVGADPDINEMAYIDADEVLAGSFDVEFATNYETGSTVAVCFGVQNNDGSITWYVVDGTVGADGVVTFSLDGLDLPEHICGGFIAIANSADMFA